jgi:hypothetical protein
MKKKRSSRQSEKLPCPNCGRKTTMRELANNKEVCRFCRTSFAAAHARWLRGEHEKLTPENLEPLTSKHIHTDLHFDENGQRVALADFNWDEVEQQVDEIRDEPRDVRAQAGVVLAKIFSYVWKTPDLRSALIKFSAICAGLRDDLVGRLYQDIAAELGVTKQSVCKAAVTAERVLGIHFARSRNADGREAMRRAALGHPGWAKKNKGVGRRTTKA